MSHLPPAVDASFRLLECRARAACVAADAAEDSVDEVLKQNPSINFDDDDPSLVRHIEDLQRVARGSSPDDPVAPISLATTPDAADEDPGPSPTLGATKPRPVRPPT